MLYLTCPKRQECCSHRSRWKECSYHSHHLLINEMKRALKPTATNSTAGTPDRLQSLGNLELLNMQLQSTTPSATRAHQLERDCSWGWKHRLVHDQRRRQQKGPPRCTGDGVYVCVYYEHHKWYHTEDFAAMQPGTFKIFEQRESPLRSCRADTLTTLLLLVAAVRHRSLLFSTNNLPVGFAIRDFLTKMCALSQVIGLRPLA